MMACRSPKAANGRSRCSSGCASPHPNAGSTTIPTKCPAECGLADIECLRQHGFRDEDIWDIAEIAAMYNYTNRLASAAGWLEPWKWPQAIGSRIGRFFMAIH